MIRKSVAVLGGALVSCTGLMPAMVAPAQASDTPITAYCIAEGVAAGQQAAANGGDYGIAWSVAVEACMNPDGAPPNPNPPPGSPEQYPCQVTHNCYRSDW